MSASSEFWGPGPTMLALEYAIWRRHRADGAPGGTHGRPLPPVRSRTDRHMGLTDASHLWGGGLRDPAPHLPGAGLREARDLRPPPRLRGWGAMV